MPSSYQKDSTLLGSASTVEVMRDQLSNLCRQQNRTLILVLVSCWVVATVALTTVLLLSSLFLGSVVSGAEGTFSSQFSKVISVIWIVGLFFISFFVFYWYLSKRKTEQEFIYSIESEIPDLEQRLITSSEFQDKSVSGVSKEFLKQLHRDAKSKIESKPFKLHFEKNEYQKPVVLAGIVSLMFFVSLGVFDGFKNSTQILAWPKSKPLSRITQENHSLPDESLKLLPTEIKVQPGDIEMQRGDDVVITASVDAVISADESKNGLIGSLILLTQDDQLNWRRVKMSTIAEDTDQTQYSATLSQLTKDTVYYVVFENQNSSIETNEQLRSVQYSISLFDLPRIESLSVSYEYPEYTSLENQTENPGGDIVAPIGTTIKLLADLNKEVSAANLHLNGNTLILETKNLTATGSFVVEEDGEYFIELVDRKSLKNKNPLEYYIRAIKDREPEVTIKSPGRDKRVMPLEEVMFEINATDDYGLTQFDFNYSVIAKSEKKIDFLTGEEEKKETLKTDIDGTTTLYLEDLGVKPGDIISYSVSVADNNGLSGPAQKISDIYFLEVIPTSREFSRSNNSGGAGGGGGGGSDGSALVKTQKDVIAATWKLKNRTVSKDDESYVADGKVIRDSQAEVAERAKMSISRLTERGSFENDSYENAVIALRQSILEMGSAIDSLDELALSKALESEQRALQEILKAETQINRTEVATNRNQQGGGGGSQQRDNEDLRELFEMEMGELENRYELPSEAQSGQQQGDPKINELAERLKELARRQERLTRSQRDLAKRQEQMTEEQKRRQLEKLQREQEQLRQQLSQLSQSLSESSQSQSSQSSPQSPSQQQSSRQQQRLQQAINQMQQSAQSETASQAAAKSQKALENIQQQAEQMSQGQQQSIAELKKSIQDKTEELVQQQQRMKDALQELSRQQSVGNSRAEVMNSGEADTILEQQSEIKNTVDDISKQLREVANRSGDGESRDIQQSHEISKSLRPIQEKMDTSNMILKRGMVNLSLKLENDIETALNDLKREVNSLEGSLPSSSLSSEDIASKDLEKNPEQNQQLADQVSQLRQSLQRLQQQIESQNSQTAGASEQGEEERQRLSRSERGDQPSSTGQLQGERSNAFSQQRNQQEGRQSEQQSERGLQNTLDQSRQLARELVQRAGQGGGQLGNTVEGSARSIQTELNQQRVEDFLHRPELLEALLQPIVELDNKLKVQSELEKIDSTLYSSKEEDIPEEYKTKVENYYRVLSESKTNQ